MSNTMVEAPFFLAGGALSVDAPSYIERQADESLFASLMRGEFCYVLVSRQMGKSSLMVRTAARLRKEGVAAIVLDLNAIGHNLERDQWYYSLILQIARKLNIRSEIKSWWEQSSEQSGVQKWVGALELILQKYHSGKLVIFVDEIDQVQLLPSSNLGRTSDEFFAAIRSCYSRRSEDADFNRLTFCLLGVALPSDLISDHRITPFNIGTRIELADFNEAQVLTYKAGLEREEIVDEALLERVYYWTGGHPYLTQRLCRAIVEAPEVGTPKQVDELCERLFLSSDAQEQDDNLLFVRDRILRSDTDVVELLALYGRIVQGKRVINDKANRLLSILLLSGIVRSARGRLEVRNRIYAQVFNKEWVHKQMPDAEMRRQRAAYRKGVMRTAAIATAILTLMAVLTLYAVQQRQLADRRLADSRHLLYVVNMNLVQRDYESNNIGHVVDVLHETPHADFDFEWAYWNRLCHLDLLTLNGHTQGVTCVAFSPDGRRIVTASDDGTARVWEAQTGKETLKLNPQMNGVSKRLFNSITGVSKWLFKSIISVSFSPDGRRIVTGSYYNGASVWDAHTGRRMFTLNVKTRVFASLFSQDGQRIVTHGDDTTRLWDARTGRVTLMISGHGLGYVFGYISPAALSPNGRRVVTASFDNATKVWDAQTGREILALRGHAGNVYAVDFSPNGRQIVTGSDDTAEVWDAQTGRKMLELRGHSGPVNSVAFSPDGRRIVTGSDDRTVRLWDANTGKQTLVFKGHRARVRSVAFSPDGRRIVTGSDDRTAKVWDIQAGRQTLTLDESSEVVNSVAFSADSHRVVTGSADCTANVWDAQTGKKTLTLNGHSKSDSDVALSSVAFSLDGRRIVTGSGGNTARVCDARTGRVLLTLKGHTDAVISMAFSVDGRYIITGSNDETARLWDIPSGRVLRTFQGNAGRVNSVAFSPDGRRIVTGNGNTAKVWDTQTGQEMLTLKHDTNSVTSAAFSPDGQRIVTGSDDNTAKVWDAQTGRQTLTLKGHDGSVNSVAFSPDGQRIVTGSTDKTAKVWDTVTGLETLTLKGHKNGVNSVAFSADGRCIVTGSSDGTARVWYSDDADTPLAWHANTVSTPRY